MSVKSTTPRVLSTSIAAVLGLAALGIQANAQSTGIFSTSGSLGTTDQAANVGLSTTKTYREAVDLGDTVNTTVNGVQFTGSGTSITPAGTGWSITGLTNAFGGGGTNPTGALGSLTDKFVYGGNPATMTLSGLTVGETYVLTFYNRSWEAAGQRVQNITASGASSATTTFDENIGASGQGALNLLRYTFQASSATQTLSISPQVATNTMHLYAFTTEQTFNNAWTGGANWSTATWSVGQPNGVGSNASFGAQAAPTTINLDAARTVGHLQFDGTNAWTVAGSNPLTLQTDVGGVSVLSALAGSHTVSTPVVLASDAVKLGSGSLTLSGVVSGTKALNVNGGTLTLGAANSFTGGTTVNNGGTLRLGAAGALGATNANVTVNTGGALDVNGTSQSIGTLNGTGTVLNNATGTSAVLTVGTGSTSNNTFAGVLSDHTTGTGTLGLTKVGTGTLTLTGANTYSGLTTISDGRLQLNGSAAAGTLSTSGINVGTTGTLGFTNGTGSTLALKAGSTLTVGGGTIAFDLASSTNSDKITADTLALTANSTFALTPVAGLSFGSTYTLATYNTLSNPGSFTIPGTSVGRLTMNPVIGANAITVTPTLDSGTWNNASGGTWSTGPWTNYTPGAAGDSAVFGPALTANGTVTVDSARSVGYLTLNNSTASYTIGTSGSSNLTLDNSTLPAMVDVKAGSHTIAENVALASDAFVTTASGTTLTIKGVVSGAKSLSKFGEGGTLLLTGAHTYSGGTTVAEGTLQLGDGTTNGSVTGNIVDNATLVFNNNAAQSYAGAISGSGKVTKTGTGTLTLTGANTVTGGLTISTGTVDIGGNSASGSFDGTITNNSTLRFSRTNAVTLNTVVNGTGNTIVSGGVSAATATTLGPTASINTPTLTIGDANTTQGWLTFGAPNQLNGTTGVLLTISPHAGNSRINLNGFSQTVSGLTGVGIIQNNEAGAPAAATFTINVPGTNSYSWTGLIRNQAGGVLNLTKTGTGEQTMNFSITNPTYGGATTVSQGRLTFGSTLAAPTWNTSGISVAAGAEVGLTGAGTGVVSWSEGVTISGAGNLVRLGADANTVTVTNSSNSYTGYTKLSGTGTLAVPGLANIGTNSSIGRGDATSAATNAASLVFDGGTLRYTGGVAGTNRLFTLTQNGGTLDASGTGPVNFTNSGAIATSGSGARTLTLAGTNTGNNTLAGAIADGTGGATSVTKSGAGTWVLSGANTYTGATTINAGRLQLEGSAATGTRATSNLALNAGGTFGFTAGTGSTLTLANTLTLSGGTLVLDIGSSAASDKIAANTLALTANSAIAFNPIDSYNVGSTYTLATYNTLSNAGNFTLSGLSAGRLTMNPVIGANAITMTPVLDNAVWNNANGGTWSTGPWTNYTPNAVGDAALFGPALTANGTVTVDAAKSVGYMTFNNAAASYTIGTAGSANLTLANAGTAAAQVVVNAGNHTIAEGTTLASDLTIITSASTGLTFSGAITGADKSVTKVGEGTLTLSGTNTFGVGAGKSFNINQGTVVLGSATALPATGNLGINGGTLNLNGNDATTALLTGTGGKITDNSATAGKTTFTVNQTGTSIFSGVIADGATRTLGLVKSGTGNLTLTGANTFTGGLTIKNGSVIAASDSGPAISTNITLGDGTAAAWLLTGASSQQYGPNTVLTFANGTQNAKFELRGTNQTLAGIDSSTAQNLSIIQNAEAGSPAYPGAPSAATLTLNTATNHSFYGLIRNQDGGPLGITKEGAGTQEMINHPTTVGFTYTGDTNINGGKLVLNLSGATAAAFASNINVNASGTLGLNGNWTLARPVTGAGSVVKEGTGSVTVSGALSHTGNTTVAAGTLVVTGSIAGTPNIDVQSGATLNVSGVTGGFTLGAAQTLKGAGTVVGAATIAGTLSPGTGGIGTLNTGALTFSGGSKLALEINTSSVSGLVGASDLVAANGAFSISTGVAPTLSLTDLGSNAALAAGTKFTLLTYTGTWNGALFNVGGSPVADEGVFTFGANQYRLDYNAGGNSVAITAVPEPSVATAALTGLAALLGLRRRRKA